MCDVRVYSQYEIIVTKRYNPKAINASLNQILDKIHADNLSVHGKTRGTGGSVE